jgi:hypothetical protein
MVEFVMDKAAIAAAFATGGVDAAMKAAGADANAPITMTVAKLAQFGELLIAKTAEGIKAQLATRDARIAQLESDLRTVKALLNSRIEEPR